MAGSHHDKPRPDEDTDLGKLWQDALVKYHEECGTDLRALPVSRLDYAHIKAEQDRQLLIFSEYRHDKGKLDKLRSLIATNSNIVVGVATHIANAASSAFPPSAAILTAFNYVMNASKAVSEDYDMIVSFFDIMNSFLERVSMLESRMPGEWQFRRFLVNVFSAMLTLSAIARKCRMKGRLSKWAKALIDGSDPKLKGAFDALHMHLERFESAAMLTTLKHTLESGKKLDSLGQDVKRIHDGVEKNIMLTQDAAATSHEILTVVTRQDERGAEYTAGLHQVMKRLNKMSKPKDAPSQLVDAGSRKSIAMRMLQESLNYYPEEKDGLTDFESYHINGTCNWFREQDVYLGFEAGNVRLLWISGPAGMGKSTLAYTVVKALQDEFFDDTTTSVAHYFFQEDGERSHVSQMFQSCALQIATRNSSYREQAVADVQLYDKQRAYAESFRELYENQYKMWELLFRTKFSKKAGSRLILVLDGVDEVAKEDYRYIEMILEEVSASEDMNIQIIFTSESRGFKPGPKVSKTEVFELTKDLILPDIQTIIMERLKRVERLRKLSQVTKRRIVARLPKKADTMRYVDHMLRRLEQLGRERAVVRELDNLPASTNELYEILLKECQKGRSDEEIVVLRQFFAWLAYTTEGSIGCMNKLLRYISEDTSIDIDEELERGCSRILGLTRVHGSRRGKDDSDTDTENLDDDQLNENDDGDIDIEDYFMIVGFQGKGLRNYFRPIVNSTGDKLRMTESSGHVAVLRIIESILCTESDNGDEVGERILQSYASTTWHQHLRAINREKLSQEETVSVMESTCRILSNSGGSIEKTERHYHHWDNTKLPCVLGDTEETIKATLSCLQEWALSVAQIPPPLVSDTTLSWLQKVARNPREVFIQVAESHVRSWLTSYGREHESDVNNPFLFAHYALYQALNLPAVQQNEKLRSYLSLRGNNGMEHPHYTDPEPFVVVSRAFPHIDMTAQGHLSVATSIFQVFLHERSLRELHMAIRLAATDFELMEVYLKMAEILVDTAMRAKGGVGYAAWKPLGTDEAGPEGTDGPGSETSSSVDGADEEPPLQEYDEWVSQALHAATKAADIASKLPAAAMQSTRVRDAVGPVWIYKAIAEIMSGDVTNTISYCRRAVEACKKGEMYWNLDIITPLADSKEWTTLIGVLKVLETNIKFGFAVFMERYRDAIHEAAKATGEIEYIIEQYRETIFTRAKVYLTNSDLLIGWARFYRDVVATAEGMSKARELLDMVIDTRGSTEHVTEASFCLSDILLEEFRRATQAEEKKAAYDKMQDLVRRLSESMGAEFDPTQSQTVIPLAHMARKMDAVEFQEELERTFQGCVAALTDETGWNDRLSMRVLARVLALVGLEEEAQIAATSQLYVLDMDIYVRENGDDDDADIEGSEISGTSDTAAQDDSTSNSHVEPDPSDAGDDKEERSQDEEDGSSDDVSVVDGDLGWNGENICCPGCRSPVWRWSRREPRYLCYYCAELELCQGCFDKRAARIAGEPSDDWRLLCPEGHRHIQMPVKGWGGIKDGVIRLNREELPFREWLDEVKEKKWPEAWVKFWSEER